MSAKHTPGPWRIGKTGGSVVCDTPIPEINGSDSAEYYGGHLVAESIATQNMPLIAAAPELLEALQRLLPFAEDHTDKGPYDSGWQSDDLIAKIEAAKSALAKATGTEVQP